MKKVEVGILGATGIVGQRLISLIENHPWFQVTWVAASERSAGKKYTDGCSWRLQEPLPERIGKLFINHCNPSGAPQLIFASLDSNVAGEVETEFANAGHVVVSNSGNHRMNSDIPLIIPEINSDHLSLIKIQKRNRGWKGAIITNPNCTTIFLAMSLAPLDKNFGLKKILMTSMQAVSGAGYPGVPALDILGNVIPYIPREEEKVEAETKKILAEVSDDSAIEGDWVISAQCNRVMVENGHTEAISVALKTRPTRDDLIAAWQEYRSVPQERKLPSAPPHPIIVREELDRPQPKLDAYTEGGMATVIGRVRSCPVLEFKYVALGHNTIRGAAGASLLNAELIRSEGYLD